MSFANVGIIGAGSWGTALALLLHGNKIPVTLWGHDEDHVRGIVTTYTKTPYLDRLLHHLIEASPEEEARRISDFYVGRVIEFYRRLIDQGVAEGVFRRIDPVHLYFILVGTGDHLVARRRLLEPIVGSAGFDSNFARSFGDELFNIVFCGVRAEAATSGDATA